MYRLTNVTSVTTFSNIGNTPFLLRVGKNPLTLIVFAAARMRTIAVQIDT